MILLHPYNIFMLALSASSASITTVDASNIFTPVATKREQHLASDKVSCNIVRRTADGRADEFSCATDDHITFQLKGDVEALIDRSINRRSGPRIAVPSSIVGDDGTTINVDCDNISPCISIYPSEAAAVSPTRLTGEKKALIIRIVDSKNAAPEASAEELYQYFFKKKERYPSAAEVFTGCSNNQFTIVPATWSTTGDDVKNGVITMTIPSDVTCVVPWDFEDEVRSKLANYEIEYTYLMMVSPLSADWTLGRDKCPPSSSSDEWSGYATGDFETHYNGRKSKLEDRHSIIVHEIGHNLGLGHSGWDYDRDEIDEDSERYDDVTCTMGASSYLDETKRRCFNAAKTYYLGWFSEHAKDVAPKLEDFRGTLVSVNDVVQKKHSPGQLVTVRIVSKQSKTADLFMMYNLMEGVNDSDYYEDTFDKKVVIVSQDETYDQSWIRAALLEGETYEKTNWDGTMETLRVEVCSITQGDPDTVSVSVSLGGVKGAGCKDTNQPTSQPVSQPTNQPEDMCTALTENRPCKQAKCAWVKKKCVTCATIPKRGKCKKKKCRWNKKRKCFPRK